MILSPKFCGFRKGHSTQHAFLNLLKTWEKCLDKSGFVGTVLMDLMKAYDCHPAITLIAKYFSNRYWSVKIGSILSSYLEILRGVPKGSILSSVLFNLL